MDRQIPNSTTPGAVLGDAYMDSVFEKISTIFNAIALVPTAVANSGSDYTIIIDPVLNADVTQGMQFFIQPNVTNPADNVRIRVTTGNPYYAVLQGNGAALAAGAWRSDTVYQVVFFAGAFRILSASQTFALNAARQHLIEVPTTQTLTWANYPVGNAAMAMVDVEIWAGGGGGATGSTGGGGGGGAYLRKLFKLSDLGASTLVTIGAGGAIANPGGTTSFAALLSAFGGGAGSSSGSSGGGGGGGGAIAAGSNASGLNGGNGGIISYGLTASSGGNGTGTTPGTGGTGSYGGGGGGGSDTSGTGNGGNGAGAYLGGGGGGGGNTTGTGGSGGNCYYGGGGGAGGNGTGIGGTSIVGGNGGNVGLPGGVRGGGGGRNAAGGAGFCRIQIIG